MTLNQLIKKLAAMRDRGLGRSQVAIHKDTFWDGNGTFNVCQVQDADWEWISKVDGDGFTEFRKDGTEAGSIQVILYGEKIEKRPNQ